MGWIVSLMATSQFYAGAIQFGLNANFYEMAPSGQVPWVQVDLADSGSSVLLTLTVAQGNDIGKLSEFYMNFDPLQDPTKLSFTAVDVSAVEDWSLGKGINKFKADSDGSYDLRLQFVDDATRVLNSGKSVSFLISSSTGADLNPENFDFLSDGGTRGSYHAAARVENLTSGNQGWIGDKPESLASFNGANEVPDGSWTLTLLGIAAVSLECLRRKLGKPAPRT